MIKISIIIPIYNVERYLCQCVESVLAVGESAIEIILVNDGSTDQSGSLCDQFKTKDSRVKVIHQTNSGLSVARNNGIKLARGQYLMFLDSDDYWDDVDALSNIIAEIDRVTFDALLYKNKDYSCITGAISVSGRDYDVATINNLHGDEIINHLYSRGCYPGAAWQVLVNKNFVVKEGLWFIPGAKGEDIDWLLKVLLHGNKYTAVNDSFYVYRKYRSESITDKSDLKSIEDITKVILSWVERAGADEILSNNSIFKVLNRHYLLLFMTYGKLPESDKPIAKRLFVESDVILKYPGDSFSRLFGLLYSGFGLDVAAKLMSSLRNLVAKR